MMEPKEIDDRDFDVFVKGKAVVVVDFWAPWCQPCLVVTPIVEALAKEYDGRVAFGKVNVDDSQAAAMRYQVMGVPTLLFFKGGKLVDRIVGAASRAKIEATLKKAID